MTDEISHFTFLHCARPKAHHHLLSVYIKALSCGRDTQLMISATMKCLKPAVKDERQGHVTQVFLE